MAAAQESFTYHLEGCARIVLSVITCPDLRRTFGQVGSVHLRVWDTCGGLVMADIPDQPRKCEHACRCRAGRLRSVRPHYVTDEGWQKEKERQCFGMVSEVDDRFFDGDHNPGGARKCIVLRAIGRRMYRVCSTIRDRHHLHTTRACVRSWYFS